MALGDPVWIHLTGESIVGMDARWIADGLRTLEAYANGGWQPEYWNPETETWETDE